VITVWMRASLWFWHRSNRAWFRMPHVQRSFGSVRHSSLRYRWWVFLGRMVDRAVTKWGARC